MTNEEIILDLLASMSQRFDKMDERFDSVDARFDSVDERFDRMDARMDSMDARFDKMDERMDSMDARFDRMDERFDSVENAILQTNVKIETDIESRLVALADGHAAILEQLTPRTRIDDMENEIRFLKAMVYRFSDELQAFKKAQ